MARDVTLLFAPERHSELRRLTGRYGGGMRENEEDELWQLWQQYYAALQATPSSEQPRVLLQEPTSKRIWPSLLAVLVSFGLTMLFTEAHPLFIGALISSISLAVCVSRACTVLQDRIRNKLVKQVRAINSYQIVFVPQVLMDRWYQIAQAQGLRIEDLRDLSLLAERRFVFVDLLRLTAALHAPGVKAEVRRAAEAKIDDKLHKLADELANSLQSRRAIEAEDKASKEFAAEFAATSRVETLMEGL